MYSDQTAGGSSEHTERLILTPEVVDRAVKMAMEGTTERHDFCDLTQPYLLIKVRKHSASWYVKTRDNTKKIGRVIPPEKAAKLPQRKARETGDNNKYRTLREARHEAKIKWAELANAPEAELKATKSDEWTWGQLVANYRKYLSEEREDSTGATVYPSENTKDDLKIFDRPEIAKFNAWPVSELNEDWLEKLCEELHARYTFSTQQKFRRYANAALNFTQKFHRKNGLGERKWWLSAQQRRRTESESKAKSAREKILKKRKNDFKVENMGALLARHQEFCLARTGNKRVSPSVHWGFWWDCLVGHRRGSGTALALEDVNFNDERIPKGWALAVWQPEVMKSQIEFALPIPPLGVHIINCCLRDRLEADRRNGVQIVSPWIFTSRVTGSDSGIMAVTGSAFATHIRSMRGLRDGNHRDVLEGIPHFNMHLIRSTLGDYLLDNTDLPPGTASLVIGHEIPGDKEGRLDRLPRTGKRWYFQAQQIPQKLKAMESWSQALLKAFLDAGGLYPY